jgi:uncharacterized BrkB/YihY/UPF0761 family membrane protein
MTDMRQLIKKYVIIVVVTIVGVRLLSATLMTFWPDLLTTQLPNVGNSTLGTGALSNGIAYVFNIIIIFLLYNDMKKGKTVNIPILILTFFSSFLGIIFFFLTTAYNELIIKKQTI